MFKYSVKHDNQNVIAHGGEVLEKLLGVLSTFCVDDCLTSATLGLNQLADDRHGKVSPLFLKCMEELVLVL